MIISDKLWLVLAVMLGCSMHAHATGCSAYGMQGTCISTASCTGQNGGSIAGFCPGAADIQCCVTKACSASGKTGVCKSRSVNGQCSGSFVAGVCPGPTDFQCCISSATTGVRQVTYTQFSNAVTTCGFRAPSQAQWQAFNNGLSSGKFTTQREVAMFLAQIIHESGGLVYKSEINPGSYVSSTDCPGQKYYGRGYIQLTWSYNYIAASKYLFGDNRLCTNPNQVATDESIAWGVSFWYWAANVHPSSAVQQGHFGASTKLINGGECIMGSPTTAALQRFQYYTKVLAAFGLSDTPDASGCYS